MTAPPALRDAFKSAKAGAVKRRIGWSLTPADLDALYLRSAGRCELSGIEFDAGVWHVGRRRPWAASIDRIESSQGYTRANCRIVCVAANFAMNEWGDSVLVKLAMAVATKAHGDAWRYAPAASTSNRSDSAVSHTRRCGS